MRQPRKRRRISTKRSRRLPPKSAPHPASPVPPARRTSPLKVAQAKLSDLQKQLQNAQLHIAEFDRQIQALQREPTLHEQLGPLPSTDFPVALLPVRLETRFV